jgi:phosphohistidine phosphatase SixA
MTLPDRLRRTLCLAVTLGLATLSLWPASAAADAELDVLAEPRTHAIMRHALAPGYSDPAAFSITDCTTQRQLDDAGRAQARETGAMLRAAGVTVEHLWTSQWCRCRDTAALLDLATPKDEPALNSFFEDRSTRDSQTEALRALLIALPPDETAMIVTHQVNISALLGTGTRSGEIVLFTIHPDGRTEQRGRILIPAG